MAGLIHIYCGDGKGKTTAAVGLAVRAAGCQKKVLIARFMKTDKSGEVAVLAGIPGISVIPCEKSFGFFWEMSGEEKLEAKAYYADMCRGAFEEASKGFDMLILDEIMAACDCGLVDAGETARLLKRRPADLEVVLTGRNPPEEFIEAADYVSEVRKVKHPFDKGIKARRGIEY